MNGKRDIVERIDEFLDESRDDGGLEGKIRRKVKDALITMRDMREKAQENLLGGSYSYEIADMFDKVEAFEYQLERLVEWDPDDTYSLDGQIERAREAGDEAMTMVATKHNKSEQSFDFTKKDEKILEDLRWEALQHALNVLEEVASSA